MVSSDGDKGAPATRSTRQLEPAAAASPSRTPLPKTTREFDADPSLINSRHPLTNKFHNLRSRHVTLFTAQQIPSSFDHTLDRNLRNTIAKGIEALKHARYHRISLPAGSQKATRGILHGTLESYNEPMAKPYHGLAGFNVGDDPPPPSKPARPTKPRDETVVLRGVAVPLNSDIGSAFITDLCRNKERLFSDQQVCAKYDVADDDWTAITQSKAVRLAVNAEHERRMLRGTAAQESAAKIFTESPEVMGSILRDQQANPRHRIEASKELRATARFDDEKPGADTERFTITINLGNAPEDKIFVDCGPPKQAKENRDAEKDW